MYAMPINVADQLVADRRASYERVAAHRRLRLHLRRSVRAEAVDVRGVGPAPVTIVLPRDGSLEKATVRSVA